MHRGLYGSVFTSSYLTEMDEKMCCLSDGNVEVLRGQYHHVIAAAVVGVER